MRRRYNNEARCRILEFWNLKKKKKKYTRGNGWKIPNKICTFINSKSIEC